MKKHIKGGKLDIIIGAVLLGLLYLAILDNWKTWHNWGVIIPIYCFTVPSSVTYLLIRGIYIANEANYNKTKHRDDF